MTMIFSMSFRCFVAMALASAATPGFAQGLALSDAERAAVYQAAGLQPQGAGYVRAGCDTPLRPGTELRDLNRDGQPEVLLYLGPSRCFPESLGGNVALFMKDERGLWVDRFGFLPGVEVVEQGTGPLGLPDLGVANPGGCMPVYRWNGSAYRQVSQKAVQPGGCQFRQ